MKLFAIRNTSRGQYVSNIYRGRVLLTPRFQYARMYRRRADASRIANMMNAKEDKGIFNIVEIEITEATPGKRKAARNPKSKSKRSSKRR